MIKVNDCSCKGNDKNCSKCTGSVFYSQRIFKKLAPYNLPYSPRLQRDPSQAEDPGYRSQPSVMRPGGARGLSSSYKPKCLHCNQVFSGLTALENHIFAEKIALITKMKNNKQLLIKAQKKIPCHLCKKRFNSRLELVSHVRIKHPESLSADGKSYAT